MAALVLSGAGGRGRKPVDSELNMVPMIDLLMVTIAFLLVTAVWSQMSRLQASTNVPGPGETVTPPRTPERSLHVDMRGPEKVVLSWREGRSVLRSLDVPSDARSLATAIGAEWRTSGAHTSPSDLERDVAVLHTANDTRYADMIAVMDAIEATRRPLLRGEVPAFALRFSSE
jgi:biopolymer transport protein ExbD